jgi:hypothetical protein
VTFPMRLKDYVFLVVNGRAKRPLMVEDGERDQREIVPQSLSVSVPCLVEWQLAASSAGKKPR